MSSHEMYRGISCEGPIKDKLTKIYDAAEGFRNKNNSHSDQMKIWIEKIKVKTINLIITPNVSDQASTDGLRPCVQSSPSVHD